VLRTALKIEVTCSRRSELWAIALDRLYDTSAASIQRITQTASGRYCRLSSRLREALCRKLITRGWRQRLANITICDSLSPSQLQSPSVGPYCISMSDTCRSIFGEHRWRFYIVADWPFGQCPVVGARTAINGRLWVIGLNEKNCWKKLLRETFVKYQGLPQNLQNNSVKTFRYSKNLN